ncbi:hypothetical protein P0D71_00425 [Paraburkholderia sp. RL17-383-BIF-A]|uniref:hypothetical protein n=1 Tax=Paraburkholderia sp. RL17-383-BIF-A TaxID=3031631 RepID=UPI0038BCAE15
MNLANHLFLFAISNRRLNVVARRDRVKPIPPDVRPQLGQREARVMRDNALAQFGSRFSSPARAQVQIVDACLDRSGESFALSGLGRLEVGSEVHASIIDHFDLLKQIFLHVDQND